MVFLEQDGIVFVLIEMQDRLKILLVEVFVLELADHDVSFFGLSEAIKEHSHIMLDLLG